MNGAPARIRCSVSVVRHRRNGKIRGQQTLHDAHIVPRVLIAKIGEHRFDELQRVVAQGVGVLGALRRDADAHAPMVRLGDAAGDEALFFQIFQRNGRAAGGNAHLAADFAGKGAVVGEAQIAQDAALAAADVP